MRESRVASWAISWWAICDRVPSPVLRLRSQRGKLLEVTCTRIRCPARNTWLVDHRSTTCSVNSPGVAAARTTPSAMFRDAPGDLEVRVERVGGVDEDVRPGFDLGLVEGTGRELVRRQQGAAGGRHRA